MRKIFAVFVCFAIVLPNTIYADEKSFESITDNFMEIALQNNHIVGAAVVVVTNGTILFTKGYGLSELENHIPVNAETTAFQIASISKLFTATAVMQMVEQGKLSLDEDVNNYLTAFKIENPFETPVTLRTLLTHTSGIDDRMPLYVRSNGDILFADMPSLETTLRNNLGPVVNKPGTICQYNVFGMALAGYLVELVSNMPLNQYIIQNIFVPIAMVNSSYGLTHEILKNTSKPYNFIGGNFNIGTYTLISNHPSGSIFASASDMGKFILAHLNNSLLTPETAALMHSRQFPQDSRLTGYGLGFYEEIRNGHRTIGHGGYLPSFISKMSLFPEENLGVFIVLNTKSNSSNRIPNMYIDMFYDFFTTGNYNAPFMVDFDMDACQISGQYSGIYGKTDFTRIKSVLEVVRIDCDENGNLTFTGEGEKWQFYYVGDSLFFCDQNNNYLRVSNSTGEWILTVLGHDYTKVPSIHSRFLLVTVASLPFFLISFIVLLVLIILRRKGMPLLIQSFLVMGYATLNICIPFLYISGNTGIILNIIKPLIPIVCYASVITLVFSVLSTIRVLQDKKANIVRKICYLLLIFIVILCIIFMFLMNGFVL